MFYGYYYYQDFENENDIDYAFCSKKCYKELGYTNLEIETDAVNYCQYCQNCDVKVVSGGECLPDNPCDSGKYQCEWCKDNVEVYNFIKSELGE